MKNCDFFLRSKSRESCSSNWGRYRVKIKDRFFYFTSCETHKDEIVQPYRQTVELVPEEEYSVSQIINE